MRRVDLVSDCFRCAAICCIATSFEASEDFAYDKPAGVACRHVTSVDRCRIHGELIERGFLGCALYDCHGAGPHVTRRRVAEGFDKPTSNALFLVLREVHELLWLLDEAGKLCSSHRDLETLVARELASLGEIADLPALALLNLDVRPHRESAHRALRLVGARMGGRRRLRLI